MNKMYLKKTNKKCVTREDLENLPKEELVNRILQLEAHILQLKNVIGKHGDQSCTSIGTVNNKRPFDFSKCTKRHIFLKLLYMGWDYQGFATQEDTTKTIEFHLFAALEKSCLIADRQSSNYHRCGRTDKGVSAYSQVISLDVRSHLSQDQLELGVVEGELVYPKMLNRVLPEDIRVLAWCPVSQGVSARFDCKQRTYKYFFPQGNLDIEAMNNASQDVVGCHDFRNLCKMDVANGVVKFERVVTSAKVTVVSQDSHSGNYTLSSGYNMCELTLSGQAFLWHQVRCIMGVLLLVGQGKEKPEIIQQLLDVKQHPRKPQYCLANEIPLNLFQCEFECSDWQIEEKNMANVVCSLQKTWSLHSIKALMVRAMLTDCESIGDIKTIQDQDNCLLEGVRSKVYQPLFERQTCESLESRIHHYVKKQRLEVVSSDQEKPA